ncbi:MAG: HupE/UreJ family protein [Mojavia pulchra JT2-VF2]|jgi:urease accessory protein|uniref:HupE/UreJ family protein n=1 Tax=Mojavia pulchra JT2-VF2 TaxID=287848 RepID=A0A951Q356_9NOST|nr:HupE/UreJ family protein [Mojavia pulchra JT2-VF2]
MLAIELSPSTTALKHRHLGAIAVLALISVLSSLSGFHGHESISNCWEGLLWGIADPVISLDRLASIVAIGLLSAGIARGALIAASFVLAAVFGTAVHFFYMNLAGADIAIAISTVAIGVMLMSKQPNLILLSLLGALAGLFHGYANAEFIVGAGILPLVVYVLGVTLTQCVLIMSAREINQILPSKISLISLAFAACGIVFLSNSIRAIM